MHWHDKHCEERLCEQEDYMMVLERDCQTQSEWGRSFAHWFVEVVVAVLEVAIAIVGARVATADTKVQEL